MKKLCFMVLSFVMLMAVPLSVGARTYELDLSPDDAYDREYNDVPGGSEDQEYNDILEEEEESSSTKTTTPKTKDPEKYTSPKTGDYSALGLAVVVCMISGGVVLLSGRELKRA